MSTRPTPAPPVPDITVTRKDWVRVSRVHLNCRGCGTVTVHVPIASAHIYWEGFHEHVCGPIASIDLTERPALARMLLHMCGEAP